MRAQKPPGYDERKRQKAALPGLSPQMRTALGAACAERGLVILDHHFTQQGALFRRALDLSWRYALGEPVDQNEVKKTVDACEALIEALYDDDDGGSPMKYALEAISYTLQSTADEAPRLIDDAMMDMTQAAQTDDAERGDAHMQEEIDWQMQALDVAEKAARPARDLFAHLPANPKWRKRFDARIVRYDFAGGKARKRLETEMPKSPQMRTALAAACVERVLPILDAHCPGEGALFRALIDLGWRYALGEPVDPAQIAKAVDACDAISDALYERAEKAGAAHYAIRAVSFVARSITQGNFWYTSEAIADAHVAAGGEGDGFNDARIQEEADWQMRALDAARGAKAPGRGLFV